MKWLKNITLGALLLALVPAIAFANYSIRQGPAGDILDGGWGLLNEVTGKVVLRLTRDDRLELPLSVTQDASQSAFLDERHIVVQISDIATAASTYVVIPVSGQIINSYMTSDAVSTGTSTLGMYLSGIGGALGDRVSSTHASDAKVSAFSIAWTAGADGRVLQDDSVHQTVTQGQVMAIENSAATTGGVGHVTIVIRMH